MEGGLIWRVKVQASPCRRTLPTKHKGAVAVRGQIIEDIQGGYLLLGSRTAQNH